MAPTIEWGADAAAEAAHLRLLLEKQPSCLIRVAIDGALLAVNDAALSLLQADALADVLGSSLLDRIDPDHRSAWLEFAARVWERGGASLESVLAGPSRDSRHVQMQGIALQHPDRVPSIVLTMRDTSMSHQLEQSLVVADATREIERLRREAETKRAATEDARVRELEGELNKEIEALRAREQQLLETLADHDLGHQRLDEQWQAAREELMARAREAETVAATLRQQLADASTREEQLSVRTAEQHAATRRREQEWAAERARFEKALEDERRKSVEASDAAAAHDTLRAQLAAIESERDRLSAERQDLQQTLATLRSEGASNRARLEQTVETLRAELDERRRDQESRLFEAGELDRVRAEMARLGEALQAALDSAQAQTGTIDQLRADLAAREDTQRRLESERAALLAERDSLAAAANGARQEEATLADQLTAREHDCERLENECARLGEQLQAALDSAQAQTGTIDQLRADLAAREDTQRRLESERAALLAERDSLAAAANGARQEEATLADQLTARERDCERLQSECTRLGEQLQAALDAAQEQTSAIAQERAELANLRAACAAMMAERDRLAATASAVRHDHAALAEALAARERDCERLESELARATNELNAALAAVREHTAAAAKQRDDLGSIRALHADAIAEKDRWAAIVADRESERVALIEQHAARCTRLERELRAEFDQTLALERSEQREAIANVQAELAATMANEMNARALLARREADTHRLAAQQSAERLAAERALADALDRVNALTAAVSEHAERLKRVEEHARSLESYAAAGRLARDVARSIQDLARRMNERDDVEFLRGAAVQAASFARQLALAGRLPAAAALADDPTTDSATPEAR